MWTWQGVVRRQEQCVVCCWCDARTRAMCGSVERVWLPRWAGVELVVRWLAGGVGSAGMMKRREEEEGAQE